MSIWYAVDYFFVIAGKHVHILADQADPYSKRTLCGRRPPRPNWTHIWRDAPDLDCCRQCARARDRLAVAA